MYLKVNNALHTNFNNSELLNSLNYTGSGLYLINVKDNPGEVGTEVIVYVDKTINTVSTVGTVFELGQKHLIKNTVSDQIDSILDQDKYFATSTGAFSEKPKEVPKIDPIGKGGPRIPKRKESAEDSRKRVSDETMEQIFNEAHKNRVYNLPAPTVEHIIPKGFVDRDTVNSMIAEIFKGVKTIIKD